MITLCVPTISRFDLLPYLIESAMTGTVKPDKIVVIDNSGGQCPKIPGIEIITSPDNLGVAGSWNYFMSNYDDYIVISNDDALLNENTLEELIKGAETYSYAMVHGVCDTDGNSFSLFILRKKVWEEIGPFDETFFPAYFEDNDYHHRMKLKGYDKRAIETAQYRHFGSATIKLYTAKQLDDHWIRFSRNQDYYIKKWGGLPSKETYVLPFNGVE